MPPKVVLATRKIKNDDIGIDVSVPSRESAPSPKLVKYYHVVVISSLPHFKTAVHSKDAVVQFMVLRDYEAFEQLQKEMLECFPQLKLPNLPRKFHLFMKDADIEERQISFDCLLKVLCKDKKMCTSPALLRFLGFDPHADKMYFKERREYLQRLEEATTEKDEAATDVEFKAGNTMDDSHLSHGYAVKSLFDDERVTKKLKSAELPFLEDDLLTYTEQTVTGVTTEHSELLNVSEELDDILPTAGVAKDVSCVPGLNDPSGDGNLHVGGSADENLEDVAFADMQRDDILTYIEDNTEQDGDFDLF